MARITVLIAFIFLGVFAFGQQTFTVTASGLAFNPLTINAQIGDKITFNVGSFHPVLEVSEATYLANGKTALPGGFAFPSGTGTYTASQIGTFYYICTAHISSGMKAKIIVSAPTGIEDQKQGTSFELYPNPVEGTLYLKNLEKSPQYSVNIYDVAGKALLKYDEKKMDDNNFEINVSDLRKGIYFISVSYSGKVFTKKFVKN
jgi:plastocyanin